MLTLAPSVPNGRTAIPAAAQAAAKPGVYSPSRSQTKLASVGGTVQPSAISASRTRVRSLTVNSTRASSSSSAASDAMAAGRREALAGERQNGGAGARRHGLVRDHEPGPQPGQAIGLGEGAQHRDVG